MADETPTMTTEQAMRKALEAICHIPAPHPLMIKNFDGIPEAAKPYAKAIAQAVKVAKETLQVVDVGGFKGETGKMAGVDEPLGIAVGHNDSHVLTTLTQHVSTFGLLPEDAIDLARELARCAATIDPEAVSKNMMQDKGASDERQEGEKEN